MKAKHFFKSKTWVRSPKIEQVYLLKKIVHSFRLNSWFLVWYFLLTFYFHFAWYLKIIFTLIIPVIRSFNLIKLIKKHIKTLIYIILIKIVCWIQCPFWFHNICDNTCVFCMMTLLVSVWLSSAFLGWNIIIKFFIIFYIVYCIFRWIKNY